MANAPIGTVTAESKSPQTLKAGPSKSTAQREAESGEKSSKATFADALKAADRSGNDAVKAEKAGKISGTPESKGESLFPSMKMKFTGKNTGTDKTKENSAKTEKIKPTHSAADGAVVSAVKITGQGSVKTSENTDTPEAKTAAVKAEGREGRRESATRSAVMAAPLHRDTGVEDVRRQKRDRVDNVASEKRSGVQGDQRSSHRVEPGQFGDQNNRTSSARRVEVIDERNPERENGSSGTTRKTSIRHFGRTESSEPRGEKVESFSSELRGEIAETDIELSPRMSGRPASRSAAAELARKLDDQAGNEIVRQVKVVLNRSNAGEVRINLRPDNLGRVRVRIRMDDNKLTGRIFVESAAAREAFKAALDGLQTKLVESGFGAADLELAWDDSYQGFEQQGRDSNGHGPDSGAVAREFENMVPTTVVDEIADGRVNMVV